MVVDNSRWATIKNLISSSDSPSWVSGDDATRLAAYTLYEAIYWTNPDTFKLVMRGQEGSPIYLPSGREIVETAHRFLAPGVSIGLDPDFGSDVIRTEALQFFIEFARRERFFSKFSANKRKGLIKGDWFWHITADPELPIGSRVSINTLEPESYFPEFNLLNELVAVHIPEVIEIDPITGEKLTEQMIRKLVYRKSTDRSGPSPIEYTDTLHKLDSWGQPDTEMDEKVEDTYAEQVLPAIITSIPVYHVKNLMDPDDEEPWGSSEMRGVESIMASLNQGITDEDLALILEGLGVYVTNAGAPIDEDTGEEKPWVVAPGHILELPMNAQFQRVSGISNITPFQDHLNYLGTWLDRALGTNDVTRGTTDVTVAESGIALTIRMAPMLSRMSEKELSITDVMVNLLYDLRNWFTEYEGMPGFQDVRWVPQYAEKLPVNKKQFFDEVMAMMTAVPVPLISTTEARRMLATIGIKFSAEDMLNAEIQNEAIRAAQIKADVEGLRIDLEAVGLGQG